MRRLLLALLVLMAPLLMAPTPSSTPGGGGGGGLLTDEGTHYGSSKQIVVPDLGAGLMGFGSYDTANGDDYGAAPTNFGLIIFDEWDQSRPYWVSDTGSGAQRNVVAPVFEACFSAWAPGGTTPTINQYMANGTTRAATNNMNAGAWTTRTAASSAGYIFPVRLPQTGIWRVVGFRIALGESHGGAAGAPDSYTLQLASGSGDDWGSAFDDVVGASVIVSDSTSPAYNEIRGDQHSNEKYVRYSTPLAIPEGDTKLVTYFSIVSVAVWDRYKISELCWQLHNEGPGAAVTPQP